MPSLKLAMSVDANNTVVGDLYLENGSTRLTSSLSEEIQQTLYTRFRFFQGEWWLDTTIGVPWYQQILGLKPAASLVASILRQVITSCPGVARIDSFGLTSTGRSWVLAFSLTLNDGAVLTSADFAPLLIKGP